MYVSGCCSPPDNVAPKEIFFIIIVYYRIILIPLNRNGKTIQFHNILQRGYHVWKEKKVN